MRLHNRSLQKGRGSVTDAGAGVREMSEAGSTRGRRSESKGRRGGLICAKYFVADRRKKGRAMGRDRPMTKAELMRKTSRLSLQ